MTNAPGPQTQTEIDAMIQRQDNEGERAAAEYVAADRARKVRVVTYAVCKMGLSYCCCEQIGVGRMCAYPSGIARVAVDALEGL